MDIELSQDQLARLWSYREQLQNGFYQRSSLFLLAESMMFVAFATLRMVGGTEAFLYALALSLVGSSLTVVWWLVSIRHMAFYRHVRSEVERHLTEYRVIRRESPKCCYSSWWLLTHLAPALVFGGWVALFAIAAAFRGAA